MALSIGVDCGTGHWRTCVREDGQPLEVYAFADLPEMLTYLKRMCALYPEPTIVVPLDVGRPLARLSTIADRQLQSLSLDERQNKDSLLTFLIAIREMSLDSFCLPALQNLPAVPAHRRLNPNGLGTPASLCVVATLLYRLSEQQVAWSEMNFFCLEVGYHSRAIVVVEGGRIVNGRTLAAPGHAHWPGGVRHFKDDAEAHLAFEMAFWEELEAELAGLMAIHHLEDIVVLGPYKDAFIERFGEVYQVYLFPDSEPAAEGFEVAVGAAIIAEGLRQPGLAAGVVERLQLLQ